MTNHAPANLWDLEHPQTYILRYGMDALRTTISDVEQTLASIYHESTLQQIHYVNPYEEHLIRWLADAYNHLEELTDAT